MTVILAEFDSYSNSELATMVVDPGQNLDETQCCNVNISAVSYFPIVLVSWNRSPNQEMCKAISDQIC